VPKPRKNHARHSNCVIQPRRKQSSEIDFRRLAPGARYQFKDFWAALLHPEHRIFRSQHFVDRTEPGDIGAQSGDFLAQCLGVALFFLERQGLRIALRSVIAALGLPNGIGNARGVVVDEGRADPGLAGDGCDAQPLMRL
jgi:hypothetical protein